MIDLSDKEKDIVSLSPLFRGLDNRRLRSALEILEAVRAEYKKGETIHVVGSRFKCFGIVLHGMVQACCDDIDGNRVIMAGIDPGSTFGESLCYLSVEDSPVYVIAAEDSSILKLNPGVFFRDVNDCDTVDLQRRFTALIASKALEMNNRIQILSKLTLREKIMMFLNEEAGKSASYEFTIHMSREDFAAYIASDRSSLSRMLSALKKEGIIDYNRNRFRILKHK